ncbi:MAG: ATP-binding protein [Pseudomonadota bacterium]
MVETDGLDSLAAYSSSASPSRKKKAADYFEEKMTRMDLPDQLDLSQVLQAFGNGSWPLTGEIDVASEGPPQHAEPVALVAVAAWALRAHRGGSRLRIADALKSRYTLNVGLLSAIANKLPWSDEAGATDNFFPLCRIAGERRVDAIPGGVVQTLHIPDADSAAALATSIHEIVRNAEEHSRSDTPATFCAGWFRNQRRVTFAVADNGVGILRALRRKGVANLEDDDKSAIEKAIQPFVTGAGERGDIYAPDNAGLGLHNTRTAALDAGGSITIFSGKACFYESYAKGQSWLDVGVPWPGTVVAVTLKTDRKNVSRLSPLTLGAIPAGSWAIRWEAYDGESVLLKPPVDATRFAMNKAWYKEHQAIVSQAIAAGKRVHVDFGGARYSTQSALHAFLATVVRENGPEAMRLLSFSDAAEPLRDALRLVVMYAMDAYVRSHEA